MQSCLIRPRRKFSFGVNPPVLNKRTGSVSPGVLRWKFHEQSDCSGVVIKWVSNGHQMLGIIECKTLIAIRNAEKSALLLQVYKVLGRRTFA